MRNSMITLKASRFVVECDDDADDGFKVYTKNSKGYVDITDKLTDSDRLELISNLIYAITDLLKEEVDRGTKTPEQAKSQVMNELVTQISNATTAKHSQSDLTDKSLYFPCKLNDTVYFPSVLKDAVLPIDIIGFQIATDKSGKNVLQYSGRTFLNGKYVDECDFLSDEVGRDIFLAKEDAEKELIRLKEKYKC